MRHTLKEVFDHNSDGLRASVRHTIARLFRARRHEGPAEDTGPAPDAVPGEPGQAGPGPMGLRYPPGTEPGVLQYRVHEDSPYFGTQNADAAPTGNTFQERTGAATGWDQPDEDAAGPGGAEPDRRPS